jgi:hypothetical protein
MLAMNEPIVRVDAIALSARTAVDSRLPATACPYPTESAAGMRWLTDYHAHAVWQDGALTV